MTQAVYVLDACVLIEAARRYYAFDLVPRFWESLKEHLAKGRVRSIDRVWKELERGKDDLADWASIQWSEAFVSTDDPKVTDRKSVV